MESKINKETIYEYSNEIKVSIEELRKIKEGKLITIESKFEISDYFDVLFEMTLNKGLVNIKLISLKDFNFVLAERNFKDDVIVLDKEFSFLCDKIRYTVKLV